MVPFSEGPSSASRPLVAVEAGAASDPSEAASGVPPALPGRSSASRLVRASPRRPARVARHFRL